MRYLPLLIALAGCGPGQPFHRNAYSAPVHEQTTAEKLDSQVGIMTYEVALQWFGPPMKCAEAGQTKTCIWTAGPDGAVSSVYGAAYGGSNVAGYGESINTQVREGPRATLAFANDKLVNWRLTGKWQ